MDSNNLTPEADLSNSGINTSGMGKEHEIPDGIKGWSWGAFLLNWIWALGNRTQIGLFAFLPYVGFIMMLVLGFKGREWAWRNKKWDSIEHFQNVQKKWSVWSFVLIGVFFLIGFVAAIALPGYQEIVIQNPGV